MEEMGENNLNDKLMDRKEWNLIAKKIGLVKDLQDAEMYIIKFT